MFKKNKHGLNVGHKNCNNGIVGFLALISLQLVSIN